MKEYCPTLRIVFLMIHEKGDVDICFLGGYNCLPEMPLSESGTLHKKYKTSLKTIHSSQIEPQTYTEVLELLYEPLSLFYKKILELYP